MAPTSNTARTWNTAAARRNFLIVGAGLAGGRVPAGMNVNVWGVTDAIAALVRSGHAVDPARPADPAVPLNDLHSDMPQGART